MPTSSATTLLALLALVACRDSKPMRENPARDLTAALQTPVSARDTAAERADSQFHSCLYVYDNEEKQRECLVLRSGWSPEDAERRLAARRAELQRQVDSITEERMRLYRALERREDSIQAIARRKEAQKEAQEARKYVARDSQILRDSLYAATFPVWASKSKKLYFAGHAGCLLAVTLPDWDRALFGSVAEAERAGYAAYNSNLACRVDASR